MKRVFLFFVAMCIMLSATVAQSVWDGTHTTWTNGTGTENNPYLIENAAHLAHLAYYVNNGQTTLGKYWKLTTDIDLNSLQWTPIGNTSYPFGGHFDGTGKTIADMHINSTTLSAGLFGEVNGSSVKNIGIIGNSSIAIAAYAGGIIGYATGSLTIENCYNIGGVSSSSNAGGIIGYINSGNVIITDCYNYGNIFAEYNNASGIVGCVINDVNLTINNCYNIGNISSYYSDGIIGCTTDDIINNCYNTGSVSSSFPIFSFSSGIIGRVFGSNTTINNCYNIGDILSLSSSGGITGYVDDGNITINNCYNIGSISSGSNGGSGIHGGGSGSINNSYYLVGSAPNPGGGTSQTATFMKTQEFINLLNTGPDPNSAYKLDVLPINDGYPILKWQKDNTIATLSSLTVSEGVLTPAFKRNIYNYTVDVPHSANSIIINATPTHPNATVSGIGVKVLSVGNNPFTIIVTAADGVTTLNYLITVNRAISTDATLSNIIVSEGTLTPAFSSNVYNYTVDVAYSISTITIIATASDPDAIVSGTGEKSLTVGANPFTITAIAADGVTALDYIVTVHRFDVGIVETDNEPSVRVYPNPTSGQLQVTSLLLSLSKYELQDANYHIFNVMGQLIMEGRLQDETTTINVESLPAGMYFLRIAGKTVKFVKQ